MSTWEAAKFCVGAIRELGLTKAEMIEVAGQIISILGADDGGYTKPERTQHEDVADKRQPEKADTTAKPAGKRIARAGDTCTCSGCGKHVYTVNTDVYDEGMKPEDFRNAFTPIGDAPRLPKVINASYVDNTLATDCPVCNGKLKLYLVGTPKAKETVSEEHGPSTSVSSIDPEDLGLS